MFSRRSVQEIDSRNARWPAITPSSPVPAESAFAATDDATFKAAVVDYSVDPNADGTYTVEWTGQPVGMAVDSITSTVDNHILTGANNFDPANTEIDYIVRYFVDNGDKKLGADDTQIDEYGYTAPTSVGGYWIVAMTENAKDAWQQASWNMDTLAKQTGIKAQYFEVTARSLEGVQPVNVVKDDSGKPVYFSEGFTYNAQDQNTSLGFAIDGKLLEEDVDYSLTLIQKGTGDDVTNTGFKNAGDYTATVNGMGGYQNDEREVAVTIDPLDLSTAVIYTPDYEVGKPGVNTTVDGVDITLFNSDMKWEQVSYTAVGGNKYASSADGFGYERWNNADKTGRYTFNVEPLASSSNVVQGKSASYSINVVDSLVSFNYDGVNFEGALDDHVFDLSTDDVYDASLVKVVESAYKDAAFTVTPQTAGAAGIYDAVARITVPNDFSVGGSANATFYVVSGILDASSVDVVVSFYGLNYDFTGDSDRTYPAPEYTGNAVVPSITVKNGDDTLVAGTDYTVTIALANGYIYDDGTTTTSRVVAEFDVLIPQRELTWITVDSLATSNPVENELPYTGAAIEPSFTGHYINTFDNKVDVALDPTWYTVSGIRYADAQADTWTTVDEIREAGEYAINLTPTKACKNYTWDAKYEIELNVVTTAGFADVASDAWYAEEVALAKELDYVNGMGNNLFFPNAPMSREQFAQVVYNMAGEPVLNWWTPGTYPTKYSDVSESAWSAKAISWATEAGIVNGTSETTFDPTGDITREQIATMLYRYAGNGAQADASVLDDFVDGDEVSDWAVNAMAWAVEEGYMQGKGVNDLQPQDTATRAEIAALAVRVQPERL